MGAGRRGGCFSARPAFRKRRSRVPGRVSRFCAADGVEIIHRGVQTDRAGDVRCAGFEPMRRFLTRSSGIRRTKSFLRRLDTAAWSSTCRPHSTPMPVGPQILPENAKKSQPMAARHGHVAGALRAVHERGDAELARGRKGRRPDSPPSSLRCEPSRELHLFCEQRVELGSRANLRRR